MKILVIGGSLFVGRVFTMLASEKHDLYLLNRGTYSMKEFGVFEYKMDRHDEKAYEKIDENFDCIVDFCAYEKNDINTVFQALEGKFNKYIFVSTCDVYERSGLTKKDEHTTFNYDTLSYPQQIKDYIDGKVSLENELIHLCEKKNIEYTSVRPAMIYGPYNYAPRESWYIKNIIQNHQAVYPSDATGEFQFVYVKDVCDALIHICENQCSNSYNICSPEIFTYEKFASLLQRVSDVSYDEVYLRINELKSYGIELPFPYYKEESPIYNGSKIENDFDFSYTPSEVGFQKTYSAFKNVYKK